MAPRKLQSLAAPVQAEAAVNAAPDGSSVLSTVIVVFGALGRMFTSELEELRITTSVTPFSFRGRVNTATGVLSVSNVATSVGPETSPSALSLGASGRMISSLGWFPLISTRSSVSRYERFVRSNGFAEAELPPAKLVSVNLPTSLQPAALPGCQLGTDSMSIS